MSLSVRGIFRSYIYIIRHLVLGGVASVNFHVICCSSRHEWNLEELMENIWEYTRMIRIYTKVSQIEALLITQCIAFFLFM